MEGTERERTRSGEQPFRWEGKLRPGHRQHEDTSVKKPTPIGSACHQHTSTCIQGWVRVEKRVRNSPKSLRRHRLKRVMAGSNVRAEGLGQRFKREEEEDKKDKGNGA